jgi:hypothetical protein
MRAPSDPPTFTPVPLARQRHDGWTPERRAAFLSALAELGLVGAAARSVGMSRKSAFALRARAGAESFAAAWDAAVAEGCEQAIDHGVRLATQGELRPIFYRGRQVGEERRFNTRLMIAALIAAARDPAERAALREAAATTRRFPDDLR